MRITCISSCGEMIKNFPQAFGLFRCGELESCSHKIISCYGILERASDLAGFCEHGNRASGSIKG
jgi:hypothetical protein